MKKLRVKVIGTNLTGEVIDVEKEDGHTFVNVYIKETLTRRYFTPEELEIVK